MILSFPNFDALTFALTVGLIPDDVVTNSARTKITNTGMILVEPAVEFPPKIAAELSRFGITYESNGAASNTVPVKHWLEIIPLVKSKQRLKVGGNTPILFIIGQTELSSFINEILRLGNDRIAIHPTIDNVLVLVHGPPYYSLLAALDRPNELAPRAFLEQAPRFWVEAGWSHPLANQIIVPDGQLTLVLSNNEWHAFENTTFQDVAKYLVFTQPDRDSIGTALPSRDPLNVALQLAPSTITDQPTLWVMRGDFSHQLDRFVQNMDQVQRDRFSFAVCDSNNEPVAILRLRPSRLPRLDLSIPGAPFHAYLRLPNLFVPLDHRINPPLRRETVRSLVAADPGIITWLIPTSDGSFTPESLPDADFLPFSAWIDEIIVRDQPKLNEWLQTTQFAFAELTQVDEQTTSKVVTELKKRRKTLVTKDDNAPGATSATQSQERRDKLTVNRVAAAPVDHDESALRSKLHELEQRFIATGGQLDSDERRTIWPQLARLNEDLNQTTEAALAWTYAMWHQDRPPEELLWGWVRTERILPRPEASHIDWDQWLQNNSPTPSELRGLAAVLVWVTHQQTVPASLKSVLLQLQTFLQAHEHLLPVRTNWLAWLAWTRAAGGDPLTLARARDRILTRLLDRGLNSEIELPAFLRLAGREDADHIRAVRGWIEDIRQRVRHWHGAQTYADLRTDPTAAYIDLLFAFGFARLGEVSAAENLVNHSKTILTATTGETAEAHEFLLQAFAWRINEVVAGRNHAGPLPNEMLDYLAQMRADAQAKPRPADHHHRDLRNYAIERMREQSRILEPQEKFDPYRGTRIEEHRIVREATALPDTRDMSRLPIRISELLRASTGTAFEIRVLVECIAVAGRLTTEAAGKLLDRVIPALDAATYTQDNLVLEVRLRLVERSLFFAAHFDRVDLIPNLIERLLQFFESDSLKGILDRSGHALGQTLVTLRKLGLRDDTLKIVERVSATILKGQSIEQWTARPLNAWAPGLVPLLQIAAGWAYLDQPDRAEPIIAAAKSVLRATRRPVSNKVQWHLYVRVLCDTINALGHLPSKIARSRISELFEDGWLEILPNNFTVRSFYSWFHVNVAETVVLAVASQDFALGPAARHWLDENEYMIRRRVHRDVRQALQEKS